MSIRDVVLVTLGLLAIIGIVVSWFSRRDLQRAGHIAHLLEGFAVTGALIFAGFEYWQHYRTHEEKKREAVYTHLLRSFDPKDVDAAYGELYRTYADVHTCNGDQTCENKFDDKTGTLMSYFWASEKCVDADLCSEELLARVHCEDFANYYEKYLEIHGAAKTADRFENWKILLKNCIPPEKRAKALLRRSDPSPQQVAEMQPAVARPGRIGTAAQHPRRSGP